MPCWGWHEVEKQAGRAGGVGGNLVGACRLVQAPLATRATTGDRCDGAMNSNLRVACCHVPRGLPAQAQAVCHALVPVQLCFPPTIP